MAVEDAAVGQQDLQQRNAAAVRRIGMADAHALGGAEPLAAEAIPLLRAGRGAARVIFRRVREDRELLPDVELRHLFYLCSSSFFVQRL
jgi:hypothetical protein